VPYESRNCSSKLFFDWSICDATHVVSRSLIRPGHRVIICEGVNSPPVRALASAKPRPNIGFRYTTCLGQATQIPSTEGDLRYYLCLETKSNFSHFFRCEILPVLQPHPFLRFLPVTLVSTHLPPNFFQKHPPAPYKA